MGFKGLYTGWLFLFLCVFSAHSARRPAIIPPDIDLVFDIDETLVRLLTSYPSPELRAALGPRFVEISYEEYSSAFGQIVTQTERYILAEGLLEFFNRLARSPLAVRVAFYSARESRRNEALLRAIAPSPNSTLWQLADNGKRLRSGEDMTVESEGKKDLRIFPLLDPVKAVLIDDCWGFLFGEQNFLQAQPSFDTGLEKAPKLPASPQQKTFYSRLFSTLDSCFGGLGFCRDGNDFIRAFKTAGASNCEAITTGAL